MSTPISDDTRAGDEARADGGTPADGEGVPAGPPSVAGLELRPALEAVLMVVDEPATVERLATVLQRPPRAVADALRELADEYTRDRRGYELRLVAGGKQLESRAESIIAGFGNRPHIFNLGHGIVPETPIENVERLVRIVKGG